MRPGVTETMSQNRLSIPLLLACGAPEFLARINFPAHGPHIWELAGVVSRKKQLLPYLLQCLAHGPTGFSKAATVISMARLDTAARMATLALCLN